MHYSCKKGVDRTGKKYVYFIDTDEIPYQRGEEQNREEGEMAKKKLGGGRNWLRSREKGDLLPCPPPSYQVSFTPNT